ncbi:hypothetical protein C8R43DRAFT_1052286 [Mycena crocata]|nr:hypothetical protein C8R43DRAFT_1052286 [Mycena crocata]
MLHAPTLPCESMVEDMHPPVSSSVGHLMLSGDRLFDLAVNLLVNDDTPAGPLQHIITGAVAALPAITSATIAAGKLAAGPEPCEASSPIVINHIAKPSAKPDFSAYRIHRPPGVPAIPLYQLTSDFMDDPENLRAPRNTPSAYRPAPGIVDINQIRRDAGRKHTPVPSRTVPRR